MNQALAMANVPELPEDLDRIRTLFLQMCVRAESMIAQSVRSVLQRDPHLARGVVAADEALDDLEIEIDGLCVRCLALRRPSGYDLRLVTTVLKMVTDLERIGDLAVNIAERGLDLGVGPGLAPGDDLAEMGRRVVAMVREAADGFVRSDAGTARRLQEMDETVDAMNRTSFNRWLEVVAAQPDQAERAMAYTSISRYLERAGDHAVNVGKMVVLLVEGRDIRHGG